MKEMPIDLNTDKKELELSTEYKIIYQEIKKQIDNINEEEKGEIFEKLREVEKRNGEIESEEKRKINIIKLSDALNGISSLEIINKFIDAILDSINEDIEEQNTIIKDPKTEVKEPKKEPSIVEAQKNLYGALKSGTEEETREALKTDPLKIKGKDITIKDFNGIDNVFLEKYKDRLVELNDRTETEDTIEEKKILKEKIRDITLRRKLEELKKLKQNLKKEEENIIPEERYLKELEKDGSKRDISVRKNEIKRIKEEILDIKNKIGKLKEDIEKENQFSKDK